MCKDIPPARNSTGASRRDFYSLLPSRLLLLLIRIYQVTLSPFLGGHCRYEPTCSQYAVEAINEHGPWRGGALAFKRLLRCHPFVKGGYDPVPPRHSHKS